METIQKHLNYLKSTEVKCNLNSWLHFCYTNNCNQKSEARNEEIRLKRKCTKKNKAELKRKSFDSILFIYVDCDSGRRQPIATSTNSSMNFGIRSIHSSRSILLYSNLRFCLQKLSSAICFCHYVPCIYLYIMGWIDHCKSFYVVFCICSFHFVSFWFPNSRNSSVFSFFYQSLEHFFCK